MMAGMDTLYQKLQTARPAQRQKILQRAIGHASKSAYELHLRALLMTRLRIDGLWPPRGVSELSGFDQEDDGA